MGKRVWDWELATGEKVVAELDSSSGTEAVFVGARVASRSRRGASPRGHELRLRGVVDGAYRGSKQMRVFFAGEDCRLVVDGEALEASTSPSPGFMRTHHRRILSTIAMLAVLIGSDFVLPHEPSERPAARSTTQGPTAHVATVLPSTQAYRSSNGLLVVRYPADFRVTADANLGDAASIVSVVRDGGQETIELVSVGKPETAEVWKLEASIQTASEKRWSTHSVEVHEVERSAGKCHGVDAAIVTRQLSVRGSPVRQWSCTFVHGGHGFRLATFTPNSRITDESYLQSIVDAVTL